MKQPFNNAGVAHVQADILALPEAQRNVEAQTIRADFIAWMNSKFLLKQNQQQQLHDLPADFRQDIAHQIALVFEEGHMITFQKQEDDEDEPRGKDILLSTGQNSNYSVHSGVLQSSARLSIWIGYQN